MYEKKNREEGFLNTSIIESLLLFLFIFLAIATIQTNEIVTLQKSIFDNKIIGADSTAVSIDDKEYLESDLNEPQIRLLNMAKYLEPQIREVDTRLAVLIDHKDRLINDLKTSLEDEAEEATVIETKTKTLS